MLTYRYATLPITVVAGLTAGLSHVRGAFIAADAESDAYADLISRGYRWIRTDGDLAVFELTITHTTESKPCDSQ